MKNSNSKHGVIKLLPIHLIFIVFLFLAGCKKELKDQDQQPEKSNINGQLIERGIADRNAKKGNPLSLKKIKKIKNQHHFSSQMEEIDSIPIEQQLLYLKIDPTNITTDVVQFLEEDSTITLMEFPFADADIYGNEYALDEEKAEALKDSFVYAMVPVNNNVFEQHNIPVTRLDTLYKPLQDEDTLVIASLVEDGFITQEEAILRICFRRPEGFVRYTDTELGPNQPVINIRVTALFFGVPVWEQTNETGWFRIGWRFLFGTVITTKAVNSRVTIKPIKTTSILWPRTIINEFKVGAVHIHGWVSSCNLNSININFTNHTQSRFWAHTLNAVHFYYQFAQQDDILTPPNHIVIWAHWGNNYGSSSAAMLGHIPRSTDELVVGCSSRIMGAIYWNYLWLKALSEWPNTNYIFPNSCKPGRIRKIRCCA